MDDRELALRLDKLQKAIEFILKLEGYKQKGTEIQEIPPEELLEPEEIEKLEEQTGKLKTKKKIE